MAQEDAPLIMSVSSTRLHGTMKDRRSGMNTGSPGEVQGHNDRVSALHGKRPHVCTAHAPVSG